MKKHRLISLFGFFVILVAPTLVFGGGFAINENGTKAVGMGGAFAAQADDPSAVYFNPAGIVQLEGTQVYGGLSIIIPSATYTSNGTSALSAAGQTTDSVDVTFFIPNFYATHKLNDQVSFGFGEFSNFGLSTEWDENWEGRYITGGVLSQIETISLNPVVAYRPHQRISLSAGPVLQHLAIELKNKIPNLLQPGGADGDAKFTGDNWDWGYNLGILFWITDDVKFGASYRSKVEHTISDGKLRFNPQGINTFTSTRFDADFTTPAVMYLGLAYTILEKLTFEFDGQWTEWSSYDKLEADYNPSIGQGPFARSGIAKDKKWEDGWAYRFGVNYKLNEQWALRAGLIFDESPVPDEYVDPGLPSGDRVLYAIGSTFDMNNFTFEFAYNYLDDEGRTFNNEVGADPYSAIGLGRVTGEFDDVDAHIFSLNLVYRF